MNREAMVEAGAKAIEASYPRDPNFENIARTVLDAVLPQITNVEQVKTLPEYTILMSDDGDGIPRFYIWVNHELCDLDSQDAALMEPHDLTDGGSLVQVVWTP